MQALLVLFVATIHFHLAVSSVVKVDDVPVSCWNLTYCTVKPKNYPQDLFNNMFKGVKVLAEPTLVKEISFENRQGDPNEVDNCDAEVTFNPLFQVRENLKSPWRTVVQAPSVDYVQRIRLETCRNPDAKCFTVLQSVSEFVTFCKQKYLHYDVLVQKGDKETETVKAELPVCCSCHYKSAS